VRRQRGGGLQRSDIEAAADYGGSRQHLAGRGRQRLEPRGDDVMDAVGQLQIARRFYATQSVPGCQGAHHFLDEQRVAFGGAVNGRHQARRHGMAGGSGDQRVDILALQSCQPQADAVAHHACEHRPRLAGGGFMLTVSGHEYDTGAVQLRGHELEQRDRRGVGGVQIVEDQH